MQPPLPVDVILVRDALHAFALSPMLEVAKSCLDSGTPASLRLNLSPVPPLCSHP